MLAIQARKGQRPRGRQPLHDDVIKWKNFPRYCPFVRGIHRPSVNSPHKGQRRGTLMFSLICVWINNWVNKRETGDLRSYRAHCDVTVMVFGAHKMFGLNEYLGAKCQCYLQKESSMLYRLNTVLFVDSTETDLYTYKPCSFMLWTCCSKVMQTSTYHLLSRCLSTVAAYVILTTIQLHQL